MILSSDKSSERNLSCFFDIIKPRRMEHLQSEEPFSSDPYFSFKIFFLFQAFPDQVQPESHQLLHYRQHGPSKGEEPRYREASGIHPSTSKVDDQLLHYRQHGPSPKEEPRYPDGRDARIYPSTSKVDDQLIQVANEISSWCSILFNKFLMHFAIF